jgi:hypothetical protein
MQLFRFIKTSSFYFWLGCVFVCSSSHFLFSAELEELVIYSEAISKARREGDTTVLLSLKNEIEQREFSLGTQYNKKPGEIAKFARRAHLDPQIEAFLNKSLSNYKRFQEFVGFLFYPYEQLSESIKTNFNQLPMALRASILIAADFDFKPARTLIKASHLGEIQNVIIDADEQVDSFLEMLFCLEDVGILNGIKRFIVEDDNIGRLIDRARRSQDRIYILNAGYLFRELGIKDLTEEMLIRASELGSKRAVIEYGFFLLERNLEEGKTFFISSPAIHKVGLTAYGLWKVAQLYQCQNDKIGLHRDLKEANRYYLDAIRILQADPTQCFPEIHYAAGEFAVYCALSNPDLDQKIAALRQAAVHFQKAEQFGMEIAFKKEEEVAEKLIEHKVADLRAYADIAHRAVTAGYFTTADKIKNKHSMREPEDKAISTTWANAEQLWNVYRELVKKCSKGSRKW